MAIYLVVKTVNGKKVSYICQTDSPSSTLNIPGDYNQICLDAADSVYNMDSRLSNYKVIYYNRDGNKIQTYIGGNSFNDVYNYCKENLGASDFLVINKTDYVWYQIV